MAPSNEPVRAAEPRPEKPEQTRNERPHLGEKEPKFVIRIQSTVPC
jgi:hypothetical protein